MNVQEALKGIVNGAERAYNVDRLLQSAGYVETPYWDIYCTLADTLYRMIGEKTETFEQSVTCKALTAEDLTNNQRVNLLMKEYERNYVA